MRERNGFKVRGPHELELLTFAHVALLTDIRQLLHAVFGKVSTSDLTWLPLSTFGTQTCERRGAWAGGRSTLDSQILQDLTTQLSWISRPILRLAHTAVAH